jgi:TRAP-type uncharacterized transport system fused permease subunit
MNETKSQHSDEDVKSVRALLSSYDPSHTHKENMAYAGVLLQFGIFGAVMRAEQWPPCWLHCKADVFILIPVGWLLIHMYIGWQLNRRRLYAKIINAAMRYLWGTLPPNASDKDSTKVSHHKAVSSKFCAMLLWPCPCPFTESDVEIEKPKELADSINREKAPSTWPEEIILFLISVGMLVLILLRTLEGVIQ